MPTLVPSLSQESCESVVLPLNREQGWAFWKSETGGRWEITVLKNEQHGPRASERASVSPQSCPTLCDPTDVARQGPLSMGFSRQEYWSGLPFPSPGDSPDPEIRPKSPAMQADSLASEIPGKPWPRAVFPVNVFSGDSLSLPVFGQGQGSRVLVWSQILLGFRVPSLCHSESQQCSPLPRHPRSPLP